VSCAGSDRLLVTLSFASCASEMPYAWRAEQARRAVERGSRSPLRIHTSFICAETTVDGVISGYLPRCSHCHGEADVARRSGVGVISFCAPAGSNFPSRKLAGLQAADAFHSACLKCGDGITSPTDFICVPVSHPRREFSKATWNLDDDVVDGGSKQAGVLRVMSFEISSSR